MTQKQALDILKLGKNVFLTGAAGSGKTYVLNQYIKYLKENEINVGVTASTGIAATHMNGKTIHSWAHIGIKERLTNSDLAHIFNRREFRNSIAEAKVLIIDEVSMLHHYRLDMVDAVLQKMHGNNKPFGGIQVVLCGDLFQLPPISRSGDSEYVTESNVWQNMDIKICYLSEQYRHEDEKLSQLLNEMRSGEVSEESTENLLKQKSSEFSNQTATKLYTHNIDVDELNLKELAKLNGDTKKFVMTQKGDKTISKAMIKNCLAPEELELKKGATVMFVQNNYSKGYVNGTIGIIKKFDLDGMPVVRTLSGKEITSSIGSWKVEEGENVLAEINQIPLRLAWAITVHKSQGMTLDSAQIDLSKSFVPGMGYVALSRVKKLKDIFLLGINNKAFFVSPKVIELDQLLRNKSKAHQKEITSLSDQEIEKGHDEFLYGLSYAGKLL